MGRASVKKVKPGVWRVTDDWTGYDMSRIRHIAAGPDEVMWLAGAQRVSRLGVMGAIRKPKQVERVYDLHVAPDGRLFIGGYPLAAHDDGSWTVFPRGPRESREFRSLGVVTADGTVWARSNGGVARWDGDGWRTSGHGCYCTTSAMAQTTDGTVWMGVAGTGGLVGFSGTGLYRLDGDERVKVEPSGERTEVYAMAAGPDGSLWVSQLPEDEAEPGKADYGAAHLAHWDGAAWRAYAWPSWLQPRLDALYWNSGVDGYPQAKFASDMEVAPDGILWFKRPLMSFDGETWKRYEVPHARGNMRHRAEDFTIADDGTVWLVVRDYTDWRPSQLDGICVLDPRRLRPSRAKPIESSGMTEAS